MTTVVVQVPESAFAALRRSPDEFTRELCLAAAIHGYTQGRMAQSKAAELAGVSRVEFIDELFRRRIPATQITSKELREEAFGDVASAS